MAFLDDHRLDSLQEHLSTRGDVTEHGKAVDGQKLGMFVA